MSNTQLVIFGVITFISTIFSAASGGGSGFILTPIAIFMGLSPQQTVASGKLIGLCAALSSLKVLSKEKLHSKSIAATMMILAVIIGLIAPQIIVRIDNEVYRKLLGTIILLMAPIIFFKKTGKSKRVVSRLQQKFGWVFISITLFGQAVFGGGVGTFVNVVLMSFFGMGALEAAITKRFSQVLLNTALVIGLLSTGLIIWKVAIVAGICGGLGANVGSKIAIKKGNEYVMNLLLFAMLFSGLALIFG